MLEIDLILAVAHHLLMFALVAVLVMELMTARPDLTAAALQRLARLDAAYGALAGLLLAVGIARVFLGLRGWEYYSGNVFFWLKIACFVMVGLLSIPPTIRIARWRAAVQNDPAFAPGAVEIAPVRRFMHMEAAVLVLIPVFAALMARYS